MAKGHPPGLRLGLLIVSLKARPPLSLHASVCARGAFSRTRLGVMTTWVQLPGGRREQMPRSRRARGMVEGWRPAPAGLLCIPYLFPLCLTPPDPTRTDL